MQEYYVYLLKDSITRNVIYVGKGKGERISAHVKAAKRCILPPKQTNKHLFYKIQKILKIGGEILEEKIAENLREEDALDIEEELISKFGIDNLCNFSPRGSMNFPPKDSEKYKKLIEDISKKSKENWANPEYKEKMTAIRRRQGDERRGKPGKKHSPETKAKIKANRGDGKWTEKRREHMREKMTGREHSWGDKISESLKRVWSTKEKRKLSQEEKERIRDFHTGQEWVKIPEEIKNKIINLYKTIGTKKIFRKLQEDGTPISKYLIGRVLKKAGVYKKYKKKTEFEKPA